MKIGLVLPELPQYSETFFRYKIKGLIANGHEVTVFAAGKKSPVRNENYRVSTAPKLLSGSSLVSVLRAGVVCLYTFVLSPLRSIKLYSLERRSGRGVSEYVKSIYINSHIIGHKLDRLHFGFATTALKRENVAQAIGADMSVSFRGFDINVYPLKHSGCYSLLWKRIDRVHTISDYLREKAIKLGLDENTPFMKITPAVDPDKFQMKNNSGKLNRPLKILTVGRLNWIKDYETAISALRIVRNNGIDFHYDIVGDGKELERIRFAVYQAGLQENVSFCGKLSHDKVKDMMNDADIYLQTSMQEGFCVSVLEAQACGLICIVSDADGLRENVVDNVTGFIAERRNPAGFAAKIMEVLNADSSKLTLISTNARARVETEFDIARQDKLFNQFFSESELPR